MDEQAQIEFFQRLIGNSHLERVVYTPKVIDQIGDEFAIPHASRDEIGQILEVAANAFSDEARLEALDFERVRKDLRNLEKAAKSLATVLDTLAPDAIEILIRVGFVQRLKDMPLPRITQSEASAVLGYTVPDSDGSRCIPLSEATTIVTALGHCAAYARERVAESRKGRPEIGALVDLLNFGFQVWESVLGRSFKLYWASNGDPITDAAQFSVRIARVVEPSLTLQQIATASRKVREKGMSFSNLEEVPQVAEHYRKQFE
ncbi:hypothetical protein [Pararhodobacter sp.]|uniref:hypothetical protein n=1 Tax=Pararhodobacter sp. TaxID=2127056 RepID=UPI002AFE9B6D|nr:hypothetical protein [Pararhodobacter sp.]